MVAFFFFCILRLRLEAQGLLLLIYIDYAPKYNNGTVIIELKFFYWFLRDAQTNKQINRHKQTNGKFWVQNSSLRRSTLLFLIHLM